MTQAVVANTTGANPWIPDDSDFGARLALIRQRMGWNITEAARECGLQAENWRLWEQAGRNPSRYVTICITIASRTGCDVDWLLHGPARGEVADLRGATKKYGPGNSPEMIDWSTEPGATRVVGRLGVPRPRDNRPAGRPTATRPVT